MNNNLAATTWVMDRKRSDPLLGAVLHGYRIERLLGEGSAARVYRASHLVLDQLYAVKVLHGPNACNPDIVERLRREAQTLNRLSHPNIVSVTDYGVTSNGLPFLTMELLRGPTLQDIIRYNGKLDARRAADITRQIACGLKEAHDHGFVHRDLKPANIMLVQELSGEEVVKILDFGVARAMQPLVAKPDLTGREALLGTPRYMAPEQVINPTAVRPVSDLYALGVLLFEMLTGKPLFKGTIVEVIEQQLNAPPPPIVLDSGLEEIALSLLEKDPDKRTPTAQHVIDAIDGLTSLWAPRSVADVGSYEPIPSLGEEATVEEVAVTLEAVEVADTMEEPLLDFEETFNLSSPLVLTVFDETTLREDIPTPPRPVSPKAVFAPRLPPARGSSSRWVFWLIIALLCCLGVAVSLAIQIEIEKPAVVVYVPKAHQTTE